MKNEAGLTLEEVNEARAEMGLEPVTAFPFNRLSPRGYKAREGRTPDLGGEAFKYFHGHN